MANLRNWMQDLLGVQFVYAAGVLQTSSAAVDFVNASGTYNPATGRVEITFAASADATAIRGVPVDDSTQTTSPATFAHLEYDGTEWKAVSTLSIPSGSTVEFKGSDGIKYPAGGQCNFYEGATSVLLVRDNELRIGDLMTAGTDYTIGFANIPTSEVGRNLTVQAQTINHATFKGGTTYIKGGRNIGAGPEGDVEVWVAGVSVGKFVEGTISFFPNGTTGVSQTATVTTFSSGVRANFAGEIDVRRNDSATHRISTTSTSLDHHVPTSGLHAFYVNNVEAVRIGSNTILFGSTVVNPQLAQVAVGDVAGANMFVFAQGNNSATLSAGTLFIRGGQNAGAGAQGSIQLQTNNVTRWTVAGSGVRIEHASGVDLNFAGEIDIRRQGSSAHGIASTSVSLRLHCASTGAIQFFTNGVEIARVILSGTDVIIGSQVGNAVADGTGFRFIYPAQDATGSGTTITGGEVLVRGGDTTAGTATNKIGGAVTIRPGNGTVGGEGRLRTGGNANRLRWDDVGLGLFGATPVQQPADQVQVTDNTAGTASRTWAALPNPADAPATADALRDDLVANVLPVLRNWAASAADWMNDHRTNVFRPLGITA